MSLGGRLLPRFAALATMWLVLDTLGAQLLSEHNWALWSILALTIILELLAYQHGVVQGMLIYRDLTPEQRKDIDKIIKEANNE